MSSTELVGRPTREAVFEPLVTVAKARVVKLVEEGALAPDDGEFLLRALIELESDGIELFGPARPAHDDFYAAVADYLVARVGRVAVEAPVLAPETAEAIAVLGATEGRRVSQLLGLARSSPGGRDLDRAVLQLICHPGGRA
jgi:hypothetical protein